MGFDAATVLASAGVSAVVGALVSLIAVSQVTVRTTRAQKREVARERLAEVVSPWQREIARYRFTADSQTTGRRDPGAGEPIAHLQDHVHVTRALQTSANLGSVRRRLVVRRCRRIFGSYWVDLCLAYPPKPGDEDGLTSWLASSINPGQLRGAPTDSLFHRAYAAPPGEQVQRELQRELRKLAAAY